MAYAEGTTVTAAKTREDIDSTLRKYGCTAFMYAEEHGQHDRAVIGFVAHERQVRFMLTLPSAADPGFRRTPSGRQQRTPKAADEAYDAEVRRRWRALLLAIKAKLEAVATGIVAFEDEFMPYTVLPDGTTAAEHVREWIDQAYATGEVPPLHPVLGAAPTRRMLEGRE